MNCVVSNGIDVCIICEENYIVNNITGICDKLNIEINNCEYVSYDLVTFDKNLSSDNQENYI